MRDASMSLGASLFPQTVPVALRAVLLVVAGVCLMTLGAKVQIPFWPVPVTLQTLALPVIAAALGPVLGPVTMLAYLGAGFAGLPVFANTPPQVAGPAYFVGPTAGYLFAYPVAALVIGWLSRGFAGRSPLRVFVSMVAGAAVVFGLGFVWLAYFATLSSGATGLGPAAAFSAGVAPFILADLFKAALATAIIIAGWMTLDRRRA